jgi:anthranilate phosphoribosyltransferase
MNARILRDVLSGAETGAARDIVLLNAGAAIYVSGRTKTIGEGVQRAEESVGSGAALGALEDFIHTTRRIAGLA